MNWLLENWQTIAALAIVGLTVVLFTRRLLRPRRKGHCGGGCDCATSRGRATDPPRPS